MFASMKSRLRRLRFTMLAVIAALSTAVIITPASAAAGLHRIEGGTIAAVCILGILVFVLAIEALYLGKARSRERQRSARD